MKEKKDISLSIEDLKKKISSMEWDIKQGTFNKDKLSYYNELLKKYEQMKEEVKDNSQDD